MKLVVDIGNTRIKWARAGAAGLDAGGAFVAAKSPDWAAQISLAGVDRIVVANVAGHSALAALASRAAAAGLPLQEAMSTARTGRLVNAYAQPARLGVDRWMACLAGHMRAPGSVLVADAGTAITLDWVDAEGRHGGGLIAPGVAAMRGALRSTTQLRARDTQACIGWLTRDTDAAIATGTLRGAIALLDNAARDLAPQRLLLTGGEAQTLAPHLAHAWVLAPQLVLEGLTRYAVEAESGKKGGQMARGASE